MEAMTGCEELSDAALLAQAKELAVRERENAARLLRHLVEIERRKLHEREGYASLFLYCVGELKLSEGDAWRRVACARAAREHAGVYRMLRTGELNLRTLALLAPLLGAGDGRRLLERAKGKSSREVERLVDGLRGREESRDRVRHLGSAGAARAQAAGGEELALSTGLANGAAAAAQAAAGVGTAGAGGVEPLTPRSAAAREPPSAQARAVLLSPQGAPSRGRVEVRFTADEELWAKVERAKELLRHRLPGGRFEHLLGALVEAWLERNDPQRALQRARVRAHAGARVRAHAGARVRAHAGARVRAGGAAAQADASRRVPRAVQREVYARDEGRCSFASASGRRRAARAGLEFDHVVPYARGGSSTQAANLRLRCRAHNLMAARDAFGEELIAAATAARRERAARGEARGP